MWRAVWRGGGGQTASTEGAPCAILVRAAMRLRLMQARGHTIHTAGVPLLLLPLLLLKLLLPLSVLLLLLLERKPR